MLQCVSRLSIIQGIWRYSKLNRGRWTFFFCDLPFWFWSYMLRNLISSLNSKPLNHMVTFSQFYSHLWSISRWPIPKQSRVRSEEVLINPLFGSIVLAELGLQSWECSFSPHSFLLRESQKFLSCFEPVAVLAFFLFAYPGFSTGLIYLFLLILASSWFWCRGWSLNTHVLNCLNWFCLLILYVHIIL